MISRHFRRDAIPISANTFCNRTIMKANLQEPQAS
jgi:hypothetical protein